jgi:uncharacterized protein YlxW (UPF0749 family)
MAYPDEPLDRLAAPGPPYRERSESGQRVLKRWPRRIATALSLALVVGVGVGLVTGKRSIEGPVLADENRTSELIDVIAAQQNRINELSSEIATVRAEVQSAEGPGRPGLSARVAKAEAAAGLTPVTGPGLRVTFAPAGEACPQGVDPAKCEIYDRDLQSAVNALFAAGAEAIAINDQRLVATTAVRSAGGAIQVNYDVLTSPYEITAIGPPQRLQARFERSRIARNFTDFSEALGLGFGIERGDELSVPALDQSVQLQTATLPESARGAGEGQGQ